MVEVTPPHIGSRPSDTPGVGGGAVSEIGVVAKPWVGLSRSRTSMVEKSLHETMSCRESPSTSYTIGFGSGRRRVTFGSLPSGSETPYGNVNNLPDETKVPLP